MKGVGDRALTTEEGYGGDPCEHGVWEQVVCRRGVWRGAVLALSPGKASGGGSIKAALASEIPQDPEEGRQ